MSGHDFTSPASALWFVGHGTRDAAGAAEFNRFVDLVQASLMSHVEIPGPIPRCFVELQSPSISDALRASAAAGATQVTLVPLLLFAAGHRKHDIPAAVDEVVSHHPHLVVTTLDPIGVDPVFTAVAADRVQALLSERTGNANNAPDADCDVHSDCAVVLLVGRGNRDVSAQADFERVAGLVRDAIDGPPLVSAYLAGSGTSLESALTGCAQAGRKSIYLVPYLLFQGWLTHTLPSRVAAWQASYPDVQVHIGPHLGIDERLTTRVAALVARALTSRPNHDTF